MQEIIKELTESTNQRLRVLNLEFSSVIQPEIEKVIIEAAERMVNKNENRYEDVQRAKRNMETFVNELAKHTDNSVIRFSALDLAMKGICPLWPIC